MSSDWREATFQELIDDGSLEIGDGYRAQNSELGGTGPIFLRAGHVTDSHIDFSGVDRFHEYLADKVQSKMAQVSDTIVTTKGNKTGRTSYVTESLPPFVYSPHLSFWRARKPKQLCGGFLRYWSQGDEFIRQLSAMKTSTDMAPYLSLTDQRRLRITLPPPSVQKAIAAVLGALDDKIELNRRMNAMLEAMARALFQSWFIDFDPVRAKLDGALPSNLDQHTAALFPAAFDHSDAGPIPHGWRIERLGDHVELQRGNTYKSEFKELPGPYLLGLASIERNGGFRSEKLATYGGDCPENLLVHPGELFVSLKDVTQSADLLGAVARMPLHFAVGRLTQDTVKLNFKAGAVSANIVYRTLLTPEYRAHCRSHATGTTNLGLAREDFLSYPVVVPPKPVQVAFDQFVNAIDKQIGINEHQAQTLATLRDTLLPKLLSGEITVK